MSSVTLEREDVKLSDLVKLTVNNTGDEFVFNFDITNIVPFREDNCLYFVGIYFRHTDNTVHLIDFYKVITLDSLETRVTHYLGQTQIFRMMSYNSVFEYLWDELRRINGTDPFGIQEKPVLDSGNKKSALITCLLDLFETFKIIFSGRYRLSLNLKTIDIIKRDVLIQTFLKRLALLVDNIVRYNHFGVNIVKMLNDEVYREDWLSRFNDFLSYIN